MVQENGNSCHPRREAFRWKARKDGRRCAAATKKRPEEALFVALRAHDYRLRTWNRTPAAKPTRPDNKYKHLQNEFEKGFFPKLNF